MNCNSLINAYNLSTSRQGAKIQHYNSFSVGLDLTQTQLFSRFRNSSKSKIMIIENSGFWCKYRWLNPRRNFNFRTIFKKVHEIHINQKKKIHNSLSTIYNIKFKCREIATLNFLLNVLLGLFLKIFRWKKEMQEGLFSLVRWKTKCRRKNQSSKTKTTGSYNRKLTVWCKF